MVNNVQIKELSSIFFKDVINLSNRQFGDGFLTSDKLKFYVLNQQKKGFVAIVNQKVIGFVLFQVCGDFTKVMPLILKNKNELERLFKNHYPLGIIETIAVDEKATNKGVGNQLVSKVMGELKDEVTSMVSFLWEHPKGTPLATLLSKHQFIHQKTISNYWLKDSKLKQYQCKYCGTPCKCNCLVYYNILR